MRSAISFLISIGLHASTLAFLIYAINLTPKNGVMGSKTLDVEFVDGVVASKVLERNKDKPAKSEVLKDLDAEVILTKRNKISNDLPSFRTCPGKWYGGVGMQSEIRNGQEMIDEVYRGYPASEAGLLPGDMIEHPHVMIVGEPGTPLSLRINRSGRIFEVYLVRDRICL